MRAVSALLQVRDLRVHYPGATGPLRAVDGLTFALERGETYALVGESGCGKSATGLAILRLVEPGRVAGGRVVFEGRNLLELDPGKNRDPQAGGRIMNELFNVLLAESSRNRDHRASPTKPAGQLYSA